jgi:hypothetical protein
MTFDFFDTHGAIVGRVSCCICIDSTAAKGLLLGSLECELDFFQKQIPDFRFPIAVLSDITINFDLRQQGYGRQALRAFRSWASSQGAYIGFLRIGTQGDDYCKGLLWRRRLYKSEGWLSLRRPQLSGLVLHWMYCRLGPSIAQDKTLIDRLSEADEFSEYFALFSQINTVEQGAAADPSRDTLLFHHPLPSCPPAPENSICYRDSGAWR